MNPTLSLGRSAIVIGIPLCLLATLVLLMYNVPIRGADSLGLAITIDLLLTVPLVYFLLIRKTDIPKTTVVPVLIIGLLLGSYFLPGEAQSYLDLFKTWVLPLIEVSVLTYVILKVRQARKHYKTSKAQTPDFYTALKTTCSELLPKKLVMPFATEVAVFYYGFFNWSSTTLEENEYSYHKNSGTPALMGAFVFIIAVETVALHLLLARWNVTAAWILTALSTYTALQVFGFAKSLGKRPISIQANTVHLKYGILGEVEIPLNNIEMVELSGRALPKEPFTKTLSPLGALESHNLILHLKNTQELKGLYGIKQDFNVLGLYLDTPSRFKQKAEEAIAS